MIADNIPLFLIAASLGYGLGSIPFGLLVTKLAGMEDIRNIGSGNIGATNVLRTGNRALAALTLIFDGGKGALICFLFIQNWHFEVGLIAGMSAVIGHNYPIWLKFRGGKGVATTLGILITVAWPIGIMTCLTWLLVATLFRYSSLAALVSFGLTPIYSYWNGLNEICILSVIFFALSALRHFENIKNLLNGNERKIKFN